MQKTNGLILTFLSCLLTTLCFGQGTFKNCSAAFLGNRMIVDSYSPAGKCTLPATATGTLTVCTVELSPTKTRAVEKIPFQVAIRDRATQTLLLFPQHNFRQVPVQRVLTKCRKGDHIVLLTKNNKYAIPHNEILVR